MMGKPTGRRFVMRDVILSEEERLRLKEEYMKAAFEWQPPLTKVVYDEVKPGDEGYETAPVGEVWVNIGETS